MIDDRFTLTKLHFVLYLIIFIISNLYFYLFENIFIKILFSFILGWCIFAISSIAHDALHNSVCESISCNKIIAFVCLDMLFMTSNDWKLFHNKIHHIELKGSDDIMLLDGSNFIIELYNTIKKHFFMKKTSGSIVIYIYRIPFYYYRRVYIKLLHYLFIIILFNYN